MPIVPAATCLLEISHPPTLHEIPWGGTCTVDWSLVVTTVSHVVAECCNVKMKGWVWWHPHLFQPELYHQPFKKMPMLWRVGGTAKSRNEVAVVLNHPLKKGLVFFVLAFGLLGMAKMMPQRPESFIASLMLLVVLMRQAQKIWNLQGRANTTAACSSPGSSSEAARLPILQGKLDAITSPSMMFGGFAYNGVSFLFRSGAALAPSYVVGREGDWPKRL